jgi:hypothetical protein
MIKNNFDYLNANNIKNLINAANNMRITIAKLDLNSKDHNNIIIADRLLYNALKEFKNDY